MRVLSEHLAFESEEVAEAEHKLSEVRLAVESLAAELAIILGERWGPGPSHRSLFRSRERVASAYMRRHQASASFPFQLNLSCFVDETTDGIPQICLS
jgi:hypothetical protein